MAGPQMPSKSNLARNLNENSEVKCKMKLDYPPVSHSGDFFTEQTRNRKSKTQKMNSKVSNSIIQNSLSKASLKFRCHIEERKNWSEMKRRKFIQKLKNHYNIDVEGLSERVVKEIIMKVEALEKEKKQREQRNMERTVITVRRLLEEQKYKSRGHRLYRPPWRRNIKKSSLSQIFSKKEDEETLGETESEREVAIVEEHETDIPANKVRKEVGNSEKNRYSTELKQPTDGKQTEQPIEDKEVEDFSKCLDAKKESSRINSYKNLVRRSKNTACLPVEKYLESTPKEIIFQDYEKDKIYLQDLKITNISTETIHCRYLGIVVHTKTAEKFPIGVAVRDNVKLRPGLSCSTKIRLCSQDDKQELQCSIVYETRRRNEPLQHSWFFVKVVCVPVRATVKISPLKITFPSLTWCEATGADSSKFLKKYLKIENSGGKGCSCRISSVKFEVVEPEEEYGEFYETYFGTASLKSRSDVSKEFTNGRYSSSHKEFPGEGYSLSWQGVEAAEKLIDELIENVFAIFRFSEKYYIELPPFTTKQLEVRFIPHYKGFHHEVNFIQFENCDNCQEQAIEMMGDIKRMPLRVEPQTIDLRTCIANSGVYASTFRIFNESKGPYSVIVKVPSALKKHAHVHPRTATILSRNYSEFSVRIYPRVSLARDAPRYFKEDFQVLEFPLFIHGGNVGACKLDYLKIYVFALITDYCLQLSPSFINFGRVTTMETVRTELELTNYSLAVQEYGFLNLPKGVRVEPNMGFGKILPKESIMLDLLYSPDQELKGKHEFQIEVTSIAKYGGFREKLEPERGSEETLEFLWGEDYGFALPSHKLTSESDDYLEFIQNKKEEGGYEEEEEEVEEEEDVEACDEESSIEGEELLARIIEQENKIREFLKQDCNKVSEHSIFKKMNSEAQYYRHSKATLNKGESEVKKYEDYVSELGELEEAEIGKPCELRSQLHIVNCLACVVEPHCRISESVIQLPATPCSSFSLYRFRLSTEKEPNSVSCSCGFRKAAKKCAEGSNFQVSFEFQYYCPHIRLEPESGYINANDSLPITVIYRPEFPAEQVCQESRLKKAQKIMSEKKTEASKPPADPKSVQKLKQVTPIKSNPSNAIHSGDIQEIRSMSLFELEKYDLFAGERSLQELISPFYVETKVRCIVKTVGNEDQPEILEMMFICPAIKPSFIYLGNSQEINFNKVFVGTKAQVLLRAQNISFERISPLTTILNTAGPFYCPAGLKKLKVDPEHIWGQPLIYAPLEAKGIEKQYFEIYCGATNIFLTVSGEGIQPQYKINPSFSCCLMDAKPGVVEEMKLEIENLSPIRLNIQLKRVFVKEGTYFEEEEEEEEKKKKEKLSQKDENKDKKKSKNSGSDKNCRFLDEVPEIISSSLESFQDVEAELASKIFAVAGTDDNNEVGIPPSGRLQVRIHFAPPTEKNDIKYAAKYAFMLERASLLKEILVVGKIIKGK